MFAGVGPGAGAPVDSTGVDGASFLSVTVMATVMVSESLESSVTFRTTSYTLFLPSASWSRSWASSCSFTII